MALSKWTFMTAPDDSGLRLDQLIATRTGLSRRQAREALKLGGVQVARKRVRVASKLVASGTEIRVAFDPDLAPPTQIEIPIVFEDAWLLAVNKPAGLATQGTQTSDRHDVLAMLKNQRPELKLFLQHRLDLGTSGLLLFSKDPKINAALTEQFSSHTLTKTYLARISEPMEACEVDLPIGRLRHAVPGRFGCAGDLMEPKSARTVFRPATKEECASLMPGPWIIATPATGRTHQIRVHLQSIQRPVFGDGLYGGEKSDQLWLHAWKLKLRHPGTGEILELIAPPTRFFRDLP
jgi:RluA family pseudouridine synthase